MSKTNPSTTRSSEPPDRAEPIAIVGIGCRFPGGVNSPESFWDLLKNEVDAITEIPASRMNIEALFDPRPATPGRIMTHWGGFLDDIDQFDASFFGMSPREADRLDPQQRLILEVAWEAMEDAGEPIGTSTTLNGGVFVGCWLNDFEGRLFSDPDLIDFYMTTGSGRYSIPGRLSYFLGMQGPSISVDTACSSSLVAVHLACQSLRNRECALALAGGTNVILQPSISIAYSQSRMMAPDGRCKFGDARGDGYVRSEGAALIVLKRLSDAIADKNPIYAVIRGSAVNNDGRSSGFLTTPGGAGQEDMLRKAYQNANVSPGMVQYIEAHGTGTRAGDPVEIQALGAVLKQDRPAGQLCKVGSVKTNFGHTEGAAGVAGLIKVALSLKNQYIPASLHFQKPNPSIPWDNLPLRIQSKGESWPEHAGPAIAGVSAFGIAGTNAHIVLQEAPPLNPSSDKDIAQPLSNTQETGHRTYVLPVSARSPSALHDFVQKMKNFIENGEDLSLHNIAYTTSFRRTHNDYRTSFIASSIQNLDEQFSLFLEDWQAERFPLTEPTERKILFIFPGQGSQWAGMGVQLMENEPVFRAALERCSRAIEPLTGWSLIEILHSPQVKERLEQIDFIQPALFAMQVALAEQWRAWGIEPAAVAGHSMGEVAAAHIAGAINLEDAARIICRRSQLMRTVSGKGAMISVDLSLDDSRTAITGYEDKISIAVSNSPRSTVLSGDPEAIDEVSTHLKNKNILYRQVKVDVAAHSPQMEALRPLLEHSLEGLHSQPTTIPIFSTVTAKLEEGTSFDIAYWGRNLRQPVLFSSVLNQAMDQGFDTVIEISPHPVLLSAVEQGFRIFKPDSDIKFAALPSARRNENEQAVLLQSLGKLFELGQSIDWSRIYPQVGEFVKLPSYPWQRERFWLKEAEIDAGAVSRTPARLLGTHFETFSQPGTQIWQTTFSLDTVPYLKDHRVGESILMPAAAFVELVLEAASSLEQPLVIEGYEFREALSLKDGKSYILQCVMNADHSFEIVSRQEGLIDWVQHATGMLGTERHPVEPPVRFELDNQVFSAKSHLGSEHVNAMRTRGLAYGPSFQAVASFRHINTQVVGLINLPDNLTLGDHIIHPTVLDACFQMLIASLDTSAAAGDAFLPTRIDNLKVFSRPRSDAVLTAHVTRHSSDTDDLLVGDILVEDDNGVVILSTTGLRLQRFHNSNKNVGDVLYTVQWENAPDLLPSSSAEGQWLIVSDQGSAALSLRASLEAQQGVCRIQIKTNGNDEIDPSTGIHKSLDLAEPLRGVIFLAVESTGIPPLAAEEQSLRLLDLIQKLAQKDWKKPPRLWIITLGAQAVIPGESPAPALAALWGLAGTIAHEFPEWQTTRIDLDSLSSIPFVWQELVAGQIDPVALREGKRFIAHLDRLSLQKEDTSTAIQAVPAGKKPFQLGISHPGILESLELRACLPPHPAPGQLIIEVLSSGMNFIDVMKAMGIHPGADPLAPVSMGLECSGTIVAIGDDSNGITSKFKIGQEVIAFAPHSFSKMVAADAHLVIPKPSNYSFDQAATIPVVYLTAYYALVYLGRMRRGERVLIHSAAGGVGLAAIQLAQYTGAEIFATAGSDEKRTYLRSLGIQHILDSRSLDFADQIMSITEGKGIDLVLNSLTGEAITKSLTILAPYGRFLEIGKRDIYQNTRIGLLPFQKNLSYFAIDLDRMARERPAFLGEMLAEVMALLDQGKISLMPITVYPVIEAADAIHRMSQPNHIGKVVLSMADPNVPVLPSYLETATVKPDATYLITGGLGGLGLAVAGRLADMGARHLALVGRGGENRLSAEAKISLEGLRSKGVNIAILAADISDSDQTASVLTHIHDHLPTLRGIIHAAGVLDDGILTQLTPERMQNVLAPKISGAWNLHNLTKDQPLDFFVLFSSVTSILGSPGQGNYAAANAFLDRLANYRQSMGLPALSINWGPWSQIGLASQRTQGGLQGLGGLNSISPEEGLDIFARLLEYPGPQMMVTGLNAGEWKKSHPTASRSSLFAHLDTTTTSSDSTSSNSVRAALLAALPGRPRHAILEAYVKDQVAQVLRLPPARVDLHKPLRTLGLDSLMSIEFRNRLESGLEVTLSATLVWNYPTVNDLVLLLAEKMEIPLDESNEPAQKEAAPPVQLDLEDQVEPELSDISDEDLAAMLDQELDKIDDLL